MRARLTRDRLWPALTSRFGIRPPDIGRYSVAEINQYLDALEAEARREQKQRAQQRRRRPQGHRIRPRRRR